ncbi:hypothetical protein PG984_016262 [Apiospora sp. TS-2023a]
MLAPPPRPAAGPAYLAPRQAGGDVCDIVCPPEDPEDPDRVTSIPDPCDSLCNQYYQCEHGKREIAVCRLTWVFNPQYHACDYY